MTDDWCAGAQFTVGGGTQGGGPECYKKKQTVQAGRASQ